VLERSQDLEVPDRVGLVAVDANGPVPPNHELVEPDAVVEGGDDRVVAHSFGRRPPFGDLRPLRQA
jgi:hypothetical protein